VKKVTTELYKPELGRYFKTLNEEWLQRLFVIEPIDREVLANPQAIIDHGGQIIFAIADEQVVGCVALKHHGDGVIELTKMAVTAEFQAHGIGAILMQCCIDEFARLNGEKLYLETHTSLQPAIKLYQRWGFVALPHPFESEYQRSDYYMEYNPK
jgi:ribosomal protein S18 acetylase RimI-like enzyme